MWVVRFRGDLCYPCFKSSGETTNWISPVALYLPRSNACFARYTPTLCRRTILTGARYEIKSFLLVQVYRILIFNIARNHAVSVFRYTARSRNVSDFFYRHILREGIFFPLVNRLGGELHVSLHDEAFFIILRVPLCRRKKERDSDDSCI